MRRTIFALALLLIPASAQAWPAHGSGGSPPPPSTCPKGTAYADGCTGANANGQFVDSTFFTTSRVSWGSPYVSTPPWNVAGVDYPVGNYTADASLLDVKQNIPAGCSISYLSHWIACSLSSAIPMSGLRFNGIGFYSQNSNNNLISIDNSHITFTALNCHNYGGTGGIRTTGGTGGLTISNTVVDTDGTCVFNADLYKTASDPGLTTMSSGYSINIASGVLTIPSGTVTGRIFSGSYLDWSGRATSNKTQISGLTSPTAKTISSITISGTTATVTTATAHGLDVGAGIAMSGILPAGYNGDVVVDSIPDSTHYTYQIQSGNTIPSGSATKVTGSGVGYGIYYLSGASALLGTWTVTGTTSNLSTTAGASTGPVNNTSNGPIAVGSSGKVTLHYNANIGSAQFASAIGELDSKYNYGKLTTNNNQHINFVVNFPQAGATIPNFIQDYNTIWWDPYAEDNGTGTLDYFTTSTSGATAGPSPVVGNLEWIGNSVIANNSIPNSSGNTNSIIRFLSQNGAAPGGIASAINYNLNQVAGSGILKVNSVSLITAGVGLAANTFIFCGGSAPLCSVPIKITAQLTGTGGAPCPDVTCDGTTGTYSVTNTADQINKSTATNGAYLYPGQITAATVNNNYYDNTGTQNGNTTYNFDVQSVPVGSITSTGNINMKTGASCNYGGSC